MKKSSLHTKERLTISKFEPNKKDWSHILQAEGGRVIAFIVHHPGQRSKEAARAQELADAERLVASWNFVFKVPMEAGELMADLEIIIANRS